VPQAWSTSITCLKIACFKGSTIFFMNRIITCSINLVYRNSHTL
jgi:hypothetical protein